MKSNRGFTLIELLIVIGILSILSVAVVMVINPTEIIRQTRDTQRLTEINTINSGISLAQSLNSGIYLGESQKVYISLPDDINPDCSSYINLPPLPPPWVYSCVSLANLRKVDGTGWIPVNFTSVTGTNILSALPVDPTNTDASGLYYTYVKGSWELTTVFESNKFKDQYPEGFKLKGVTEEMVSLTPGGVLARLCPGGDCDEDGYTVDNGDCDDHCSTCFVGSTNFTSSPDGKDQNCDGIVDNTDTVPGLGLIVWITAGTYNGNLGGRSGADAKCVADKPSSVSCATGRLRAFLSVNVGDSARDMTTNYGYPSTTALKWLNRTTLVTTTFANNWADLWDGSVAVSPSSGTGYGGSEMAWTGSQTDGSREPGYVTCAVYPPDYQSWINAGASNLGRVNNMSNAARWFSENAHYCNLSRRLFCLCDDSLRTAYF
jgi:prepilin-type N-terminal cleavage/methylation domain-containing protein